MSLRRTVTETEKFLNDIWGLHKLMELYIKFSATITWLCNHA